MTKGGVRLMSEILIDALTHHVDKISVIKQTGIKSYVMIKLLYT